MNIPGLYEISVMFDINNINTPFFKYTHDVPIYDVPGITYYNSILSRDHQIEGHSYPSSYRFDGTYNLN